MKKFKAFFDWLFRIGLTGVLVVFLIFAPFTLFPNLLKSQASVNRSEKYEYQGILELWHIETFEGGSVSRASFLEKEAINFEKKHKGTYIVIQTMGLEQFELNIQSGKKPNILSFGVGIGDSVAKNLVELDAENVRSDLKQYGKFNSKQLAVPYILGGYALISQNQNNVDLENDKNAANISNDYDNNLDININKNANGNNAKTNKNDNKNINSVVGVGLKGTTNPLKALETNKKNILNLYKTEDIDSYDAYDKFLKGQFDVLLGTQRDVYRIWNRQQKGLMTSVEFEFLSGYTDLVQYLSVFESNDLEEKLCKEFVSQTISSEVQQKLKSYNLFSTLENLQLYDSGIYKEFESVLRRNIKSENVFISNEQIQKQKQDCFKNVIKN